MSYPLLPGQTMWGTVSSYIFGTEDTIEYATPNIETNSAIPALIKDAGFTLLRSYIPDGSSDAVLDTRLATAQACGCPMLAVLPNPANSSWNAHVVSYYGSQVLLYEFGNEPDLGGILVADYLTYWNAQIPSLRSTNSSAAFIGPVVGTSIVGGGSYMQSFLTGVVASGVLPSAVSFHWYPTTGHDLAYARGTIGSASFSSEINNVRAMVIATLPAEVGVCVTEWNADAAVPPAGYTQDPTFMQPWSRDAINSMINGGAAIACQFAASSASGVGRDMIDHVTGIPLAQFFVLRSMIKQKRQRSTLQYGAFQAHI